MIRYFVSFMFRGTTTVGWEVVERPTPIVSAEDVQKIQDEIRDRLQIGMVILSWQRLENEPTGGQR